LSKFVHFGKGGFPFVAREDFHLFVALVYKGRRRRRRGGRVKGLWEGEGAKEELVKGSGWTFTHL